MVSAAIAVMLAAQIAKAQELDSSDRHLFSAQALADLCAATGASSDAIKARVFCHGYLSGVMALHTALIVSDDFNPFACPGDGVTRDRVRAELVSWSQDRTDLDQMAPVEAVARALQERWPC